ncbi:MAG: agmatine deiminase [Sulfurimonas sp.]|nr:MAG: agmatine deiminase [Sulfurimonas sp.]
MRRWPAEFEKQRCIQVIFPHEQSAWSTYLDEACTCFVSIIESIRHYEPCVIVCDDRERVKRFFSCHDNLWFVTYRSDDTWARDCSVICVEEEGEVVLLDFTFNGWGNKFEATRDNAMNAALRTHYRAAMHQVDFVLEGGSIESDGQGTLLTTAQCLLHPSRNPHYTQAAIEALLSRELGVQRFLWLHHGYLRGDDTDSHVDMLARFIDARTIVYLQCDNTDDEHYEALGKMEQELKQFRTQQGKPYRLIALPMTAPVYYEGARLPSSYANFLMLNSAVMVPTYNDANDARALAIFKMLFPERTVIGVDCSVLIRQHGSLHCISMQFCEKLAIMV